MSCIYFTQQIIGIILPGKCYALDYRKIILYFTSQMVLELEWDKAGKHHKDLMIITLELVHESSFFKMNKVFNIYESVPF
jgi:hypothetical protein